MSCGCTSMDGLVIFEVDGELKEEPARSPLGFRVDLNEGCFLVFFPALSRNFGISCFFPILGKYRSFGKILKKNEKTFHVKIDP